MIHQKVREERERLGISQSALARSTGVPRSQIVLFESGGNVTLSTLDRILAEIPTLRHEVSRTDLDLDTAREAAAELQALAEQMKAAAAKVIAALSPKPLSAPPPPEPKTPAAKGPLPGGGGAEIYDALLEMTPELRAHLKGLVDEIEKNKGRRGREHA